jgi:hypothetical protein
MPPISKHHKTLVMLAFDPSTGKVSINGGAWKHLKLLQKEEGRRPTPPETAPKKENRNAKDFPPPDPGDDRPQCLFCDEHQSCRVHIWEGVWTCLGDECIGPFCT